jgi:hypothetical protein
MLGVPGERGSRLATGATVAGGVEALRVVSADALSPQEISRLLSRPRIDFSSILKTVRRGVMNKKCGAVCVF